MPNHYSDPERIAKAASMVQAFTPEVYAYLLTIFPTPESFAELQQRFQTNYPAALKGDDPELLKVFEADRKALNTNISLIHGLAKVVAFIDPTVSETLGLGRLPERATGAPAPLTAPRDFKVIYDRQGHIIASVAKVVGAKIYQIWACDGDPSYEANWRLLESSTNCKGITLTGLNRSKFNVLRIRATRGRETGPWSNWVSLEPT